MPETPAPNGACFCGCKKPVGYGRFFAPGHDKIAEAALMAVRYESSVPQLLAEHGYGPHNSVTSAAVEAGVWEKCIYSGCDYTGAPASIRNHINRYHRSATEQ